MNNRDLKQEIARMFGAIRGVYRKATRERNDYEISDMVNALERSVQHMSEFEIITAYLNQRNLQEDGIFITDGEIRSAIKIYNNQSVMLAKTYSDTKFPLILSGFLFTMFPGFYCNNVKLTIMEKSVYGGSACSDFYLELGSELNNDEWFSVMVQIKGEMK